MTTRHLALDLTADFAAHQLHGTATLSIENLTGASTLVLDSYGLTIHSITADGAPALWSFGDARDYGRALTIAITPSTHNVTIDYTTMSDAPGLFWNSAEQSYGRTQPYLYSLSEALGARSWIPIQDTPSMRMTYEATLHVPPQLLALMSAENNPIAIHPGGVYTFTMSKPIPSYLIALAVGRLEFHPFDERTGVYAEPELMADAAWELQYLPDMLDAAERILGPFPFARHDLLLAPPTFVAGGMEHPMLNFINPFSAVSGNHPEHPVPKSLIAHELAHSWAGDATTLATWNDVWLNEGITSYLTLRILEEMGDGDRAELTYFLDRNSYASWSSNPANVEVSRLHRQVDWPPFGATEYVKGELFLRMLEDRLGRSTLDAFLHRYFELLAFHWTSDETFLILLNEFAPGPNDLRLFEWIYDTGLPSNVTAATSSVIYDRAVARANAFRAGTPMSQLVTTPWSDTDIEQFLSVVNILTLRSRMAEVDAALGLSTRVTPPLGWLVQAAATNYAPARPAIERALMRGGPNSWITQIYNALRSTPESRAFAITIFNHARNRYLPSVAAYVDGLLFGSSLRAAA